MANEEENAEQITESVMNEGNVGEVLEAAQDPLMQKQLALEDQYRSICADEILLIEQSEQLQQKLKSIKKQRQALGVQVETLRSIAA